MSRYLPTLPEVSRELITILAATLLASYVISKVPAFKRLVQSNTVPSPV
ncbi:hypothetical protein [Pseudaquabacterium rugosum]|uniref:Uncharacterized protein n=1 Tax=Pseudaquabacterium rugosum TaxID=2984194 RepID=A0ABU9BBT2_9BURK